MAGEITGDALGVAAFGREVELAHQRTPELAHDFA